MANDLNIPEVPEPKPEDPEDVSWALSTAEAMWARGDHAEGIKWVRRAAEAASEAENDNRALELAKAAADLTGMITRMSRASIDIEEVIPMSEAPIQQAPPVPPKAPPVPAVSKAPPAAPAAAKPLAPKPLPTSVTKVVTTPSRPPAPLPSGKPSSPPPGGRTSQPPKGKPLGTNTAKPASIRPGAPNNKKARKSRENFDQANEEATALPTADADARSAAAVAAAAASADTAETPIAPASPPPNEARRPEIGNNDPTFVGHVSDIAARDRSAAEWDADSTQNLTGDDFPPFPSPSSSSSGVSDGDRKTAVAVALPGVGIHPNDFKATMQSFPRSKLAAAPPGASAPPLPPGTNPPATVAAHGLATGVAAAPNPVPASPSRSISIEKHDPGITTTQAVRVVVWRDANGVHVAPAGTVVSAITVDAVLVALEPNADLTAWLTQKGR